MSERNVLWIVQHLRASERQTALVALASSPTYQLKKVRHIKLMLLAGKNYLLDGCAYDEVN